MAKTRMINTRFWSDAFVVGLNPLDRYLFLYFLTNEHTNICGIYELPLKTMSNETGLERDMLVTMIDRFVGKVHYIDHWVYIRNFGKHQSDNDSVNRGIENARKLIPRHILEKIEQLEQHPVHTLSQGGTRPDILEPELKPQSKPKPSEEARTPAKNARLFFQGIGDVIDARAGTDEAVAVTDFLASLSKKYHSVPKEVLWSEVKKFFMYWTELNATGTKERWQKEPVFQVDRRLSVWFGKVDMMKNTSSTKGKTIA